MISSLNAPASRAISKSKSVSFKDVYSRLHRGELTSLPASLTLHSVIIALLARDAILIGEVLSCDAHWRRVRNTVGQGGGERIFELEVNSVAL